SAAVHGFRVSSFNGDHTGCVGKARPTCQQVQSLDPAIAGRALMLHVQSTRRFGIFQRMAYRARDAIVGEHCEGVVASFKPLDSAPTVNEMFTDCAFGANGGFKRAFIAHPYVHSHLQYGHRVLGVDGTFMKHGKYKSTALGGWPNGRWQECDVICDGESERNCNRFLQCCRAAGLPLNSLPVFADRGKGLITAVQRLKDNLDHHKIQIRFCSRHIVGNVRHRFSNTTREEAAIWEIQASESDEEYGAKFDALAMTHPQVADYLGKLTQRDGRYCRLLAVTDLPERKLHTLDVLKSFVEKFMTDAVAIDQSVQAWCRKGMTITPHAEALLQAQQQDIGYPSVRPSSITVAFVFDTRQVPRYHFLMARWFALVHIRTNTEFPVGVTLYDNGKSDSISGSVDKCSFVDSIAMGYGAESNHAIELTGLQYPNKHVAQATTAGTA
ncbi:TPA: hypothetical protein N0F65_008573, partial [Lagenidium giganteum]